MPSGSTTTVTVVEEGETASTGGTTARRSNKREHLRMLKEGARWFKALGYSHRGRRRCLQKLPLPHVQEGMRPSPSWKNGIEPVLGMGVKFILNLFKAVE